MPDRKPKRGEPGVELVEVDVDELPNSEVRAMGDLILHDGSKLKVSMQDRLKAAMSLGPGGGIVVHSKREYQEAVKAKEHLPGTDSVRIVPKAIRIKKVSDNSAVMLAARARMANASMLNVAHVDTQAA